MQQATTLQTKRTPEAAEPSTPTPVLFDRSASRDLEQIEVATGHLREAWRALTPVGRRHTFACGLVLEIASMMGDLAGERGRIESEAGL